MSSLSLPPFKDQPIPSEAAQILRRLVTEDLDVPDAVRRGHDGVTFTGSDHPVVPLPHKHTAAVAAFQAVHGLYASHIWSLRTGKDIPKIEVNTDHATCYLAACVLASVDGEPIQTSQNVPTMQTHDKGSLLPVRAPATAIFHCKDGAYFHTHGSIDTRNILRAVGIDPEDASISTEDSRSRMEQFVSGRTGEEMRRWSIERGFPGDICYKPEDYAKTNQGKIAIQWPLLMPGAQVEDITAPAPFVQQPTLRKPLEGIKVLEMTRVIAGPAVGRQLAELGAAVVRIISPELMDFHHALQVDFNLGKRACYVDLKTDEGRKQMRHLLEDADIFLHGYRPGVVERLGFGTDVLNQIAVRRGKGFVQIVENCYGHEGPWTWRPGYQQIADVVTGVAWETGLACGKDTPIVPMLPISDYVTGVIGGIAAMQGLLNRAEKGGSWMTHVSLVQYDMWIRKLGMYDRQYVKALYDAGPPHSMADNMSVLLVRALGFIGKVFPHVMNPAFFGVAKASYGSVRHVKPVCMFPGGEIELGWEYSTFWGEHSVGWDEEDAERLKAQIKRP